MRTRIAILGMLVLAAACGQVPSTDGVGVGAGDGGGDGAGRGLAWEHVDQVEGVLPDRAAVAVIEDDEALAAAWADHDFDDPQPTVDFTRHVVLLLGQADDACPDEMIRLEVVDGTLQVDWLPPPGACEQPLIMRVHAVRVHRAVLGDGFTYGLQPPYDRDLVEVTLDLPAFEGDAPPAPEPPQAMHEADLDAVFADHPVTRCGPEHDVVDLGSDDAEAAADPDAPTGPVVDIGQANDALADAGFDIERDVVPFMDRTTGGRLAYFVGADDADRIEQALAEEFGDRAPGTRVSPWAPADVRAAQEALSSLMGGERRPGAITETTGGPGPVRIGMVDPTRDALDAVAATVDPQLVCVDPLLSGVPG